jgi:hypothetical protein
MSKRRWWEVEIGGRGENPNPRGDYADDENIIREEGVEQTPTRPIRPVGQPEETPPIQPPTRPNLSPEGTVRDAMANLPVVNVDAQATTGGQGGFAINKIQYHPPDKNFITETRTVRHHWEGYLSINGIGKTPQISSTVINGFDLILNNIYQPISVSFVPQLSQTPVAGPSVRQAAAHNPTDPTSWNARTNFPRRMVGTSSSTDLTLDTGVAQHNHPTWRYWYEKMYTYWAPLSCNYKVTVSFNNFFPSVASGENQTTTSYNSDVIIGVFPESYVQSNQSDIKPMTIDTTIGNVPTNKSVGLKQLQKFKGIKFYRISNPRQIGDKQNHTVTITGSWKPGDRIGSVRNLTDIKQWYPTGAPPSPTWVENDSFVFLNNDFTTVEGLQNNVNVHVDMNWIMQYKDLKPSIKYVAEPTHGNNAVHLRVGIDDIQFPYPLENHNDAPYAPAVPTYSIM